MKRENKMKIFPLSTIKTIYIKKFKSFNFWFEVINGLKSNKQLYSFLLLKFKSQLNIILCSSLVFNIQ